MITAPFVPEDIDTLPLLQPDGWQDIRNEFSGYLEKNFCFPIKAVQKSQMAGVGVLICFGKTGWLAHIIVDPEKRNSGIGRFIVNQLLDLARQKGCLSISLVATDLGYPVYLKTGFVPQTRYLFFRREKREEVKLQKHPNVRPAQTEDKAKILKLDRHISGENRLPLISLFLKKAWIFEENGSIQGTYLPALGEGLIIAENDRAGLELMAHKHRGVDTAVLPVDNTAGIMFLENHGFKQYASAKRMVAGKPFLFYPEKMYSRIAGNLG